MLRRQLHQHCQARKQAPHITSTALSQQGRLSLATRKKLFIRGWSDSPRQWSALHVGQYCKTYGLNSGWSYVESGLGSLCGSFPTHCIIWFCDSGAGGLQASNLGWPRWTELALPKQHDGSGCPQQAMAIYLVLQLVSSRTLLTFHAHPTHCEAEFKQHKLQLDKSTCKCGIKHFQVFPKHIRTRKWCQLEFQVLATNARLDSKAYLNDTPYS